MIGIPLAKGSTSGTPIGTLKIQPPVSGTPNSVPLAECSIKRNSVGAPKEEVSQKMNSNRISS